MQWGKLPNFCTASGNEKRRSLTPRLFASDHLLHAYTLLATARSKLCSALSICSSLTVSGGIQRTVLP